MQTIIKYYIFCISVIFVSFSIKAQSSYITIKDVESFKDNLQKTSKKTKSIDCEFVQERHISMMTQTIVSNGFFWFKKPASIRWEYTEPYKYLIILSKGKAFIKDDKSNKEYDIQSNKMFKDLGDIMFSFVLGDIDAAEKDYKIEYTENNDNYYVKLIPVTEKFKVTLAQIDLYFDKIDFSLSKIVMKEPGEDFTSISFNNKKINKDISNDLFKFQ
jgi:outer membrane lipoprotein-sorting protein